jgi:hypothetical protein
MRRLRQTPHMVLREPRMKDTYSYIHGLCLDFHHHYCLTHSWSWTLWNKNKADRGVSAVRTISGEIRACEGAADWA